MKCILHVGPPKTGSTTIQTFLRQNKKILLDRGILALTDNQIPRKLPFIFKKNPRLTPWAKRMRLDQPSEMEKLKKEALGYIHNQIKKHKPETLILSSEGLARPSTTLRDYLQEYATDITIVYFLRRPDFRALSSYKNNIRNTGFTGDIGTEYKGKLDDAKKIRALGNCFGHDRITPVICKDSHPDKAAADGHIEALLKILFGSANVTPDEFVLPGHRNIAWDYRAVYYMREFNKIAESKPEFEQYRLAMARLLQEHFSGGEKPRIRKSVAEGIIANYQAGWEDIRQQYFAHQDTLFHMDFSMYSEDTSAQTFTPEDAVNVSLVLIESFLKDRKYKPR